MGRYTVIKELLNVRNRALIKDETFIGDLKIGTEIDLLDELIPGELPAGANTNLWLADTMNRVVSRAGVEKAGSYLAKKGLFLGDSRNERYYIDKENDEKWKVSWGHVDLEIWRIWEEYKVFGKGVKVAVLDDGCWSTDNDLSGRISTKSKSIPGSDLDSGAPKHGTHSAGLVGASGKRSVFGVAPECEIIIIKLCEATKEPTVLEAIKGISAALDLNVDIISCSFDFPEDADLEQLIKNCTDRQDNPITVVAAVGNQGEAIKRYPASYEKVFSVGAYNIVDNERKILPFSNHNDAVRLLGPGKDVLSTGKDAQKSSHDGTSAATAFVAGMFALILSAVKSKRLTFNELFNIISQPDCHETINTKKEFQGLGCMSLPNIFNHIHSDRL